MAALKHLPDKKPSAIDMVVDLILEPAKLEGDINLASSRGRKRPYYTENTVASLTFFLGNLHPRGCSPDKDDAKVRPSVSRWQSRSFLEEMMNFDTNTQARNSSLRLKVSKD
jgi:hypothetical protein